MEQPTQGAVQVIRAGSIAVHILLACRAVRKGLPPV